MQAALRRLEGDRLHDRLDDAVAGRGVHPGALHGRRRRAAAARVRGDDRRRDSGVGLRLAQPDADAVQPLPEAAARRRSTASSTTRSSGCSTPGCTAVRLDAAPDASGSTPSRWRSRSRCSSARSTCSRSCRRASCRARIRAASTSASRRSQGIGFDEMVRHQKEVADIVAQGSQHRRLQQQHRRRPAAAAVMNSGRIDHRPEAAHRAQALGRPGHRGAAAEARAGARASASFMVNPPPINLGGQQGARSLYQFTLQDTDTDELYQWAPMLEDKMQRSAGARGRQQRSADQEPAGPGQHRSRQDRGARPDRQAGRDGALQRLRHAAGVADLRAEQPVPGRSCRSRRSSSATRPRCRCCTCGRTRSGSSMSRSTPSHTRATTEPARCR